ncbi:HELP domain protein (macronuclear) [Tetrahymena thermophila SB210]|uniref:HELP domain protein n=1 Tax=Tetrahymena thermophila (strain SB210) TaxID=312017 RepID=I7LUL6_TETTS|nr:HELP domain protein [Tetrahymena thermophila SB210]EAR94225.2 HELP domain protein [Tetrahymena thermophila SB210]|eukprot:XP_001014470.2 HELP domain protein [Tetrahymena thermophila SB210]
MGNDMSIGKYSDLESMKKYTDFSPGQVDIIREKFDLMADEDLTISKDQFGKLMKIPPQEVDRIFEYFDTDSSGRIDSYEFISAIALLSQAPLKRKAELIFNLYDFDKNQTITQNELVILLKTTMSSLNSMCGKEEATIQQAEAKTKEILSKYDTNKDGSISLKEFQSFVSKDSDILRVLTSYGLISKEDLRHDFGGSDDLPDADSDLEEEIGKANVDRDDRIERIKNGIEHSYVTDEEKALYEKQLNEDKNSFKEQKYWQKIIGNTVRPDEKSIRYDSSAPPVNMSIDHIYGYRCYDTRNNIKYNLNKDLVYHHAAVGIVQRPNEQQNFYLEHTDDITCIDTAGNLVITGQLGANPLICVWDSTNLETKFVFKGVIKNGVSSVAISQDGKKIAAISLEKESSIVIYDLEKAIQQRLNPTKRSNDDGLLATGKLTNKEVFDAKFDKQGKTVIVASINDILFVTFDNNLIKVAKGVWSQSNPPQACLCIGFSEVGIVTGMFKGQLYLWKSSKFHQALPAHNGPVSCIHSREGDKKGIITGGRDGFIIIWDSLLKSYINKIDTKEFKLYSQKICAVTEDIKQENLVFGTRTSEIVEMSQYSNKSKKLTHGHWDGELWGLATSANHPYFYTVGEDNFLASWNIDKRCISQSTKLDFPARCIDLAANIKYLAVGCLNGTVLIIDPKSLVVIFSLKDRDRAVSCIKFSPDSELLVVAYAEPSCEILVYDAKNHFKQQTKIRGSTTAVTHIDFSNDNKKIIQCNNEGCELLFFSLLEKNKTGALGKQILDYKQVQELKWKTQNCIYGYNVQGIWPPCSNGGDINTIDLSPIRNILVTGDDFSKIKAFRYPCSSQNQSFNRYSGHASHVTKVRFVNSGSDEFVISIGGAEKSIIQWKFEFDNASAELSQEVGSAESKDQEIVFDEASADKGDQALAVKPYLGQITLSIPEQYRNIDEKKFNVLPQAQLALNYVFGFKTKNVNDDSRNLLKFLQNGKIVFPAAGVGIVLENKKDQSFFIKHEEDIVSLAVHPKANIVATGQMAAKGKSNLIDIYIWDSETKNVLGLLNDFHTRAVSVLEFSSDGSQLLTIGDDNDHSLAIYDWQQSRMICNSKVDKSAVTCAIWKNNNEFVTCGVKHIKFWSLQGRNLTSKSGIGMDPFSAITCITCTSSSVIVTGCADGRIHIWNGNSAQKSIKAHNKSVGSIIATASKPGSKDSFVYSAGYDGLVQRWKVDGSNITADSTFQIDLNQQNSQFDHAIISLSIDSKQEQILIGTKSAEIFLGKIAQGSHPEKILDAHYDGELWGCATDSKGARFVTCGGDKTVRIWDIPQKKQIACSEPLNSEARAVDWSPMTGSMIAVGDTLGQIILFDQNLKKLCQQTTKFFKPINQKKLTNWIEDIKFSPNEKYIALGAHGGPSTIEIFEIKESKENGSKSIDLAMSINAGLTSALTHLDWNTASDKLVVNSQAYELKFISLNQKKDVASSTCAEEDWASWTCTLGWFVKGIFPGVDGTDVNTANRSKNKKIIATGDDFGRVNLFQYPAAAPKQSHHTYLGHSSHVTRVKFSYDDKFLISTGGNDKSILVWSTENMQDEARKQNERQYEQQEDISEEEIGVVTKKDKKVGAQKFGKQVQAPKKQQESDDIFGEEDTDKGDEFMAVKPWLGAIKEPTTYYKDPLNQSKEPPVSLQLEYVHGYRAKDCRDNIRYLKSGNIVYNAAALGIVMDITSNTQRFFNLHTDDITAIDVHPDSIRVATGQIGAKPSIYVWDSNTLLPLCHFKGNLKNGISALSFSPSGDKLVAIAIDTNHELAIFDINAKSKTGGVQILLEKSGPDVITGAKWRNENEFATVGVKHFKLWALSASSIKGTKGSWDSKFTGSTTILTVNILGDDYLCGGSDGFLQVFKGSSLTNYKKVHDKGIDSVFVQGGMIFTGGRDYKVLVLDKTLNVITKVALDEVLKGPNIPSLCPEVRSISLSSDSKNMIIGTYASEIYELNTKDAKITSTTKFAQPKSIVKGHYTPNKKWTNEVWGLSTNPQNEDIFYTCSDDGTLRAWSISQKKQDKCIRTILDSNNSEIPPNNQTGDLSDSVKGRSIAVNCDGFVAVGFKDGSIRLYDSNLSQQVYTKQAKEWISDLKFSPDGSMLAAGSHDNAIYIHLMNDLKQKVRPLKKHSSYITHIDFSLDGNNLHSNCGAYELLFWDVNTGKQIPSGATQFRDEKWVSWTATLGWPVQGIWPEAADGTDINAVDRSNSTYSRNDTPPDNYYLLATGDDFSQVNIFRYPCIKKGSKAVVGKGHSSHVTNVKFSKNDDYLISTGGEDNCVFQWKVIKQK